MSEWKQKRFWTTAAVEEADGGLTVSLDGRKVRTPAKAPLIVPSRRMAEAIAAEWQAQDGVIDPLAMPFTRSANAAIDKVATQHGDVARMIADYGDSDLLCYRADSPQALIDRQAAQWDPYLDWAAHRFEARLVPRTGLMHEAQDAKALGRLSAVVHGLDPFRMTALHDLVSLSGSLVLGLAAAMDHAPVGEIWAVSRLDELWQHEQWGVDDEAETAAAVKREAFVHAKSFWDAAIP